MLTKAEKTAKLKEWLAKTQLDANVVGQTLGVHEGSVSPTVLLRASAKLIKLNKGEIEPDDRDNLKFSRFLGIEDYVKENIDKDALGLRKKAVQKIQQKKNLQWFQPGFFTPQIRSVVIGNPLTQNVDGINPLEHWDNSHRVTKLGPGGIPSIEAVPDESRQINTSSFGFFDPLHIMESDKVGVTNYIAHNVIKGKDNRLYRVMKTPDGKLVWSDHEKVLNSKVLIPEH
jgi:DNA-directed RNA polymerase beta subunit